MVSNSHFQHSYWTLRDFFPFFLCSFLFCLFQSLTPLLSFRLIGRINRLTNLCACLAVSTNTLDSCKASFEVEHQRMLTAVAAIEAKFADLKKRRDACDDSANPATCEPALSAENTALLAERDSTLAAAAGSITHAGETTTTTAATTTTVATTLAPGVSATTAAATAAVATTATELGATTTPSLLSQLEFMLHWMQETTNGHPNGTPEQIAMYQSQISLMHAAITTAPATTSSVPTTSAVQGALAHLAELREKLAQCEESDDDHCAAEVQAKIEETRTQLLTLGDVSANVTSCLRRDARFLELFEPFANAVRDANTPLANTECQAILATGPGAKGTATECEQRARVACGEKPSAEFAACRTAYSALCSSDETFDNAEWCARTKCDSLIGADQVHACRHGEADAHGVEGHGVAGLCAARVCAKVAPAGPMELSDAALTRHLHRQKKHANRLRRACRATTDPAERRACFKAYRKFRAQLRLKRRLRRQARRCARRTLATERQECVAEVLERAKRLLHGGCHREMCQETVDGFVVALHALSASITDASDVAAVAKGTAAVAAFVEADRQQLGRLREQCAAIADPGHKRRCYRFARMVRRSFRAKKRAERRVAGCQFSPDATVRARCTARALRHAMRTLNRACSGGRRRCKRKANRFTIVMGRFAELIVNGTQFADIHRAHQHVLRHIARHARRVRRHRRRCRRAARSPKSKRRCYRQVKQQRRLLKAKRRYHTRLRRCRRMVSDQSTRLQCAQDVMDRVSRKFRASCARRTRFRESRHFLTLQSHYAQLVRRNNDPDAVARFHARIRRMIKEHLKRQRRLLRRCRHRRTASAQRRCRRRVNRAVRKLKKMRRFHTALRRCRHRGDPASKERCVNRVERRAHRLDPRVAQHCHKQRKYLRLMRRFARLTQKRDVERATLVNKRLDSMLTRWREALNKKLRESTCQMSQRCRFGVARLLRRVSLMLTHVNNLAACKSNSDESNVGHCTRVHVNAARRTARCGYRAHRGSRHAAAIRQHLTDQLAALAACTDDECRATTLAEVKSAQEALHQASVNDLLANQNRQARLAELAKAKIACGNSAPCLANVTTAINAVLLQHAAEVQQDEENAVAFQALREMIGACVEGEAGRPCRKAAHEAYRQDILQRVQALNTDLRAEARTLFLERVQTCRATYGNATGIVVTATPTTAPAPQTREATMAPISTTAAATVATPTPSPQIQQALTDFRKCVDAAKASFVTDLVQLATQRLAANAQEQVRQCNAVTDSAGCIAAVQTAATQDQAVIQADAQAQADALLTQSVDRSMLAAGAKLGVGLLVVLVVALATVLL